MEVSDIFSVSEQHLYNEEQEKVRRTRSRKRKKENIPTTRLEFLNMSYSKTLNPNS
jgi:hypothetical protein